MATITSHIVADSTDICGFSVEFFDTVFRVAVEKSRREMGEGKTLTIGVTGVSEKEIQEMNKIYLGKDTSTDVLSFPESEENILEILKSGEKEIHLGDIFLCCEVIGRYAEKDGVSKKREMVYIFSHGVLHLLGYDHEPEMFSIQDEVCDMINE